MCRNIKTLFNFEPPATHVEIHASALQFVRKLSGFNSPSQANAEAFYRAVSEVSDSARRLLASLQTQAPAREKPLELLKKISPVAWQHIHFLGHYLFRDNRWPIDLEAILANVGFD